MPKAFCLQSSFHIDNSIIANADETSHVSDDMLIVVPTCAAYGDILGPFVHFFNKFWQDCPYRKIFINSPHEYHGFENFRTRKDLGWIANLLEFTRSENVGENILLLLDDYLLCKPVSTPEIADVDRSLQGKIGYIRLIPYSDNDFNSGQGWMWPSKVPYNEKYNFVDIDRDSPQKLTRLPISLQPAIWSVEFIKTHFDPEWSPWQQEVLGSREFCWHGSIRGISCDYLFLTTRTCAYLYVNGIRDGKFSPEFVQLLEQTPELQPFPLTRDVAIPVDKLEKARYRELIARQTDGTYPKTRYG